MVCVAVWHSFSLLTKTNVLHAPLIIVVIQCMACGFTHHIVISLHCVQCNRMSPLIITALCYRNFRLRRDCGRWGWLQYTSRWDYRANQASLKSTLSIQPHLLSFLIKTAFLTLFPSLKLSDTSFLLFLRRSLSLSLSLTLTWSWYIKE